MKRLMLLGLLALTACRQSSLTAPTIDGLVMEQVRVSLDAVTSSVPVGSCKWRTAEVKAYWLSGGTIPTIATLSDGHQVYIGAVYSDPSTTWALFDVADYPARWCWY